MRVFCHEHKRGFFAPRQSPIKCGNRGDVLGELDFQGTAKLPVELHWQYCCNCEHFCPIDFERASLERCPVCTRRTSSLYICDRCYTISFESNTPLPTKNFSLTPEGSPQPSCPGCLHAASADLNDHICEELGLSFITPLKSCPACRERLDLGPSFPSTVALYLRRTKAANKLSVTFDYENELFVPVDDGEFVLVSSADKAVESTVLPRTSKFATTRDFYEYYQDFYHCTQPGTGNVNVVKPATVVYTDNGWKLNSTGVLEIISDKPKTKAAATVIPPVPEKPPQKVSAASAKSANEDSGTACHECGTLVESKYAFCWRCGSPLSRFQAKADETEQPSAIDVEDDEQTVQHDLRPAGSSILSLATRKGTPKTRARNGSFLKLTMLSILAIMAGSLSVIALSRLFPRTVSVTAEPIRSETNPDQSVAKPPHVTSPTPAPVVAQEAEEQELDKLRERRLNASISERPAILQTFKRTEKKFPNDYRFPYERAKLAIDADNTASHQEAFSALSIAAEKAIASGKAREMLENLQKDSGGDFHKLSHGHREWVQLQEALKSEDTKSLNVRMGL